MEISLRKYLYGSSLFHLVAVAFLILSPYLPFNKIRLREEKILWVELPRGSTKDLGSIRRALGLPQTTIDEQRRALPDKNKKPSMTYEKPKSPAEEARAMREALARVGREVAARAPAPPEAAQIPKTVPEAAPGGILTGGTQDLKIAVTDPEYVFYQAQVRERIIEEWIIPLKFADPSLGLICQITVLINGRGEILSTEWELESGNASFDLSAMRAIEKASPLDPPPERLKWEAVNEGFLVEFKAEEKLR